MLKWTASTAIVAVAIAIVITWQANSCETQNQESQAATTAQPFTSPMLVIPAGKNSNANQEHSQNQTGRTPSHTNSIFCRVMTPANLPTIYLVLIGFGGIAVAIGTLRILETQTKAAKDNIELLINKERARIQVEPGYFHLDDSDEYEPPIREMRYRIKCGGTTGATILEGRVCAEVSITSEPLYLDKYSPMPLPRNIMPTGEGIELTVWLRGDEKSFPVLLDEGIEDGKLFVTFWGLIKYTDIFSENGGFWTHRFRYHWFTDRGSEGRWIQSGQENDNSETWEKFPKKPN